MVRAQQRHARNDAIAQCSIRAGRSVEVGIQDRWSAALVALYRTDLPSSENLARHALIEMFLTWSGRKLIQVAEYQSVRSILITQGLLRKRVKRVLRGKFVGLKSREDRDCAIRIRKRLGDRKSTRLNSSHVVFF